MKHYLTFEEFRDRIIRLPDDESVWRMKCESCDGISYSLSFSKHLFEDDDGAMHPFVVYSFPMTSECGLIQQHGDGEWDDDITGVWQDIVSACDMTPYVETG